MADLPYVIVRRDPDVDMEIAGTEAWLIKAAMEDRARDCFTAMLSACPPSPPVSGANDDVINCERRAADAHLIAAAPDLYEALYDLVAVCEKQPRISKSFPDPGSPLGKARSALAKARGEA